MEYSFNDIKNKHKNKACIIVSPGPNLAKFNYKKFNGKIICIGDSILRGRKFFNADYWICANNEFPNPNIKWHLEIINRFKKTFFIFSDTALYDLVWKKSNLYLNKNLKVKWIAYDDRHIKKKKCFKELRCCKLLVEEKNKNKLTIQEYVSNMYSHSKICKPFGSTVAEKALSLGLILGCNPILLHGIDLPENQSDHKYFKDNFSAKVMSKVSKETKQINRTYYIRNMYFIEYLKEIKLKIVNLFFKKTVYGLNKNKTLNNFQILLRIAKKNNIKIISLSNQSSLMKLKNIIYKSKDEIDEKYFI